MNINNRKADHPIDPVFLRRWSPRAFTDAEISEEQLLTLLEAARWAPSSFNSQPWRFIYARRNDAHWQRFLGLLDSFNRTWAERASALVIIVSRVSMQLPGLDKEAPSYSHSFDAGAAWAALALQATLSGWHARAMVGFDLEKTAKELSVPSDYRIEVAIAIGQQGDPSLLPEKLAAREAPSERLPLSQLARAGGFS
jgi:nitroreductase